MSRGELDELTLGRIANRLPDLQPLWTCVCGLSPDFISMNFDPNSTIPVAAVSLYDAVNVLSEARYALHEAYAHRIWYSEKSPTPNPTAAIFFSRFYLDDAALRLYAAGEHVATAIIMMLEIDSEKLKPYRKERVSLTSIIGHFLKDQMAGHPITRAVLELASLQEWQKTITYRNKWVHDKPPTIQGLGIVYERRKRWKVVQKGDRVTQVLHFGGGDTPQYSIDDLFGFIQPALVGFTQTLTSIAQFYLDLLRQHGIRVSSAADHGDTVT